MERREKGREGGRKDLDEWPTIQQYQLGDQSQGHSSRLLVVHHSKNTLGTSSFSKHLAILNIAWRNREERGGEGDHHMNKDYSL